MLPICAIQSSTVEMSDKSNANQVSNENSPIVTIGSRVTFLDEVGKEHTYTLADPVNTDLQNGLISILSPVDRALLSHKPNDEVLINAPKGQYKISIKIIHKTNNG